MPPLFVFINVLANKLKDTNNNKIIHILPLSLFILLGRDLLVSKFLERIQFNFPFFVIFTRKQLNLIGSWSPFAISLYSMKTYYVSCSMTTHKVIGNAYEWIYDVSDVCCFSKLSSCPVVSKSNYYQYHFIYSVMNLFVFIRSEYTHCFANIEVKNFYGVC